MSKLYNCIVVDGGGLRAPVPIKANNGDDAVRAYVNRLYSDRHMCAGDTSEVRVRVYDQSGHLIAIVPVKIEVVMLISTGAWED